MGAVVTVGLAASGVCAAIKSNSAASSDENKTVGAVLTIGLGPFGLCAARKSNSAARSDKDKKSISRKRSVGSFCREILILL